MATNEGDPLNRKYASLTETAGPQFYGFVLKLRKPGNSSNLQLAIQLTRLLTGCKMSQGKLLYLRPLRSSELVGTQFKHLWFKHEYL